MRIFSYYITLPCFVYEFQKSARLACCCCLSFHSQVLCLGQTEKNSQKKTLHLLASWECWSVSSISSPRHGALPPCALLLLLHHLNLLHVHLHPHLWDAHLHGEYPHCLSAPALTQGLVDGGPLPPQLWPDMAAIQVG